MLLLPVVNTKSRISPALIVAVGTCEAFGVVILAGAESLQL